MNLEFNLYNVNGSKWISKIQIPSSMIIHIHCIFDILIKVWEVFALLSSQFSTKIKPLVIPKYGELLHLYPVFRTKIWILVKQLNHMYKNMPKNKYISTLLQFCLFVWSYAKVQSMWEKDFLAFAESGMNLFTPFHKYHMCSDLETIFWFDLMPKNTTIGILYLICNKNCYTKEIANGILHSRKINPKTLFVYVISLTHFQKYGQ